mmetsp:Transcript_21190/g.38369  ORF Transcript_21190/g.38369 Transcript_21190/m.38369 type:complete len:107 (+) Transcript_21190:619-939(+)
MPRTNASLSGNRAPMVLLASFAAGMLALVIIARPRRLFREQESRYGCRVIGDLLGSRMNLSWLPTIGVEEEGLFDSRVCGADSDGESRLYSVFVKTKIDSYFEFID